MVDVCDPTCIFGFLFSFQIACYTNLFHECAARWLAHFFMKKSLELTQKIVAVGPDLAAPVKNSNWHLISKSSTVGSILA